MVGFGSDARCAALRHPLLPAVQRGTTAGPEGTFRGWKIGGVLRIWMIFRGFCSIFKYWRNIDPATRSLCFFRVPEVVSSGLQWFAMVLLTAARPCVAPLMPRGAAVPQKQLKSVFRF